MRVLQLIMKPQRRGAEVFARDLSNWLESEGHQTRIVALYQNEEGDTLGLRDGDVVLNGEEFGRREKLFDPLLAAAIAAQVRDFRPDVVSANGGRTLKYSVLVRRVSGDRALWVYRNIGSPKDWLRTRASKAILPVLVRGTFDAAVAVSAATLRQVHQYYGFQGASVSIPNGVDFSRLVSMRSLQESRSAICDSSLRHVILWVGSLGPEKRPDVAVDVLARLARPDVGLAIIGTGPWLARVESHVARLGVQGQVRLLGSRSDIGDLMRAADVFLLTSDTEGIPGVILEASHCGLPIVAFDVGGLRECVDDGRNGLIVGHGDIGAAALAVAGFLDDSDRSRRAGEIGVEKSAGYSIESIGHRYVAFYREQIARRLTR